MYQHPRPNSGADRDASPTGGRGSARPGGASGVRGGGRGDDAARVKEACRIEDVVGEVLTLKRRGREFVCLCPFHDDRTPSMNVVPHKQIFVCFACQAAGDVFGFVQRYHGVGFREALEMLAQRSGIELTPWRAGSGGGSGDEPSVRERVSRANAFADGYFRSLLTHAEHGAAGRGVIASRGISAEMVGRFGLGVSADRWDGLLLTAQGKGVPVDDLVAAGLIKQRPNGPGHYDALRNRLIFPIHDQFGRVIAFGARKINPEDEPKYLNSPETALFEKSATLYGLHQATQAIKQQDAVIVTEGYTDCIACHQAGFAHAVATLGTALTARHGRVLSRLCGRVILLFDGDAAGRRATERALDVLFASPLDVRVATLAGATDAKDPDELLKREGGKAVFERVLAGAQDLLEYRLERLRADLVGKSIAEQDRVVSEELRRLAAAGLDGVSPVRYQLVVRQIAGLLGIGEAAVRQSIPQRAMADGRAPSREAEGKPRGRAAGDEPARVEASEVRRVTIGEDGIVCDDVGRPREAEMLLGILAARPGLAARPALGAGPGAETLAGLLTDDVAGELWATDAAAVALGVTQAIGSGGEGIADVLDALGNDEGARRLAILLAAAAERRGGQRDDDMARELMALAGKMRARRATEAASTLPLAERLEALRAARSGRAGAAGAGPSSFSGSAARVGSTTGGHSA